MKLFILYLIVINIFSFWTMGDDKSRAKQGKRRVPEKKLFGLSAIGGALGTWLGMRVWRHKTKHTSFILGVPALLLMNIAAIYFLVQYFGPGQH
ncbi:DUF1294 domain-containing protein [Paenibacillus cremeus]|uniref:DUF1294 domain-containing protein n=1 Tax=Paenibacillus cremeus TaxID=2163881 RepID=A0A559KEH8_9BACL|nr:DUF1294 domain-containing protein [Paenibacillus cremeus]TVY10527.1 DUF1294 domain-containing protein [Paenibacillus cremeus]